MIEEGYKGPVNSRKGNTARKSASRLAAVQILYQIDHSGRLAENVIEEFLTYWIGQSFDTEKDVVPDKKLCISIVRGVELNRTYLDTIVKDVLTESWKLERLELILKAILRAAVYELKYRHKTPTIVVIAEYVSVAKAFYSDLETGMINGALDNAAQQIRGSKFFPEKNEKTH